MREWLSNEFTPPVGLAEKIAKTVVKRAKRRRKIERTALFIMPFFVIAAFVLTNNYFIQNVTLKGTSGEPFSLLQKNEIHQWQNLQSSVQNSAKAELQSPADKKAIAVTAPESHIASATFQKNSNKKLYDSVIRINKVDHSLEITWDGEGDYVVYKCDSPKFDRCSVAEVVSGNRYLDRNEDSAKIVYYRVEPLKKG